MNLIDLVGPGPAKTTLHFLDEGHAISHGDIWDQGLSVSGWYAANGYEPIAMVLSNSSPCVTVFLGAISAGATVVSIPPPPRGADLEWYATFVRGSCMQSGVRVLVVDGEYLSLLPHLEGMSYVSYQELLNWKTKGVSNPDNFSLVQFTSGSTAAPKGIVLGQEKITSNILTILDWLEPQPGDGACTWLPLSHDMGLIGMFLAALAGAGPDWGNGIDLVVLTPEGFLRRPLSWLESMSQFGSTITSAPNFGFEMVMKRKGAGHLNLSTVRACITGAEPVRAETLTRFASAFESAGFSSLAFCPAYGLAECTLAVAAVNPCEHWNAVALDPSGIADGAVCADPDGIKLVSSGTALSGVEIEINARNGGIGEILVKGDSVTDEYANGSQSKNDRGFFQTNDLGFISGDEIYVVGRQDDVFQVAGRNIYALDVEAHVGDITAIRAGRVVAIHDGDHLMIVAETESQVVSSMDVNTLVKAIRERIRGRIGLTPRLVAIVSRGKLPMTSSGKTQRALVRDTLLAGALPALPGSLGL